MSLLHTEDFDSEYARLCKSNPALQRQINAKLLLLDKSSKHPSLRLHKIKSVAFSSLFAISVNKSIRILIDFDADDITLYHIGKHEDIY